MLFLDCEFDGFDGELISMAMVSSSGNEFYEVLHTKPTNKWVIDNVMPKLGQSSINDIEFSKRLHEFLKKHTGQIIVADSPADFKHLLTWLEWIEGDKYQYLNLEIKMQFTPSGAYTPENPHNALSDAKALMKWYIKTYNACTRVSDDISIPLRRVDENNQKDD